MNGRERMIAVCRGLAADRPPVWLMRQAGRYLPEYRGIRSEHGFWEMVKTPSLAAELSLQPVRRFGMDAAIVFSDILTVPDAMGVNVRFDGGAPELDFHPGSWSDLEKLLDPDTGSAFSYVAEAVSILSLELHPSTAVIGFAGAPFTLSAYLIDGGPARGVHRLKAMALTDPDLYRAIAGRVTSAVIRLLKAQINAGADLVQIFDTWAGHLSPDEYGTLALPYTRAVIEAVKGTGVPVIVYLRNAAGLLEGAWSAGCDALSVDCSIRLSDARGRSGDGRVLQGNHAPSLLFGTEKEIREAVRKGIDEAWVVHENSGGSRTGSGYIVNLGQGVTPETPVEGVRAFVDAVKSVAENG